MIPFYYNFKSKCLIRDLILHSKGTIRLWWDENWESWELCDNEDCDRWDGCD